MRTGMGILAACALVAAGFIACSDATAPTPISPSPSMVTVNMPSAVLRVGQSEQAQASGRDANGNAISVGSFAWASSDAAVATVTATGRLTAVGPGSATITATAGNQSGTAVLTVTMVPVGSVSVSSSTASLNQGQSLQLTAVVSDTAGNTLTDRTVTWSSSAPNVATVSASGLVTAMAAGAAMITATSEGKSGSASLTVALVPIASIRVTAPTSSVAVGQTLQATATPVDSAGNTLTGRTITWSSSATTVATVSSSGLVTGVATGSATITATAEGKSGNLAITVTPTTPPPPPPVASVAVTLASSSIQVGQTTQATAVTRDAGGNVLTGRVVTWGSSTPGVATVSASGLVTAVTAGTATITATSEGKSGNAAITVTQAPVATVSVSVTASSLTPGQSTQATAVPKDAAGHLLTGLTTSWSSSNTAAATVSSTGLVTAVAAGSANITATIGGVSGLVAVSVASAPPPPTGCANPQAGWIWCDDFETDRTSSYFEYTQSGSFARHAGTGMNGSTSMRATWTAGQQDAGSLKLAFGKTPSSYFRAVDAGTSNYREVYWRVFVKSQAGWIANGNDKFSRAIVLADANWSEAAIGHIWGGYADASSYPFYALDPVRGTDSAGNVVTVGYNDFAHFTWLGAAMGSVPVLGSGAGQWYCVEVHMKLNDAGQSNGVFEEWINGTLDAQRTGLNWLGSYNAFGINAVFLENYLNNGAAQAQVRDYDDLVVSTQRVGCTPLS